MSFIRRLSRIWYIIYLARLHCEYEWFIPIKPSTLVDFYKAIIWVLPSAMPLRVKPITFK